MTTDSALYEEISNPLDSVEDVLSNQDWSFLRPTPDEVMVKVKGKRGQYRMTFLWQEEYSAMQFFCEYDMTLPTARHALACNALRALNERLWMGHFDLPAGSARPTFRHTSLFRGMTQNTGAEQIEDLVEIALAECERHHNVFAMLASPAEMNDETLSFMLTDEAGEA